VHQIHFTIFGALQTCMHVCMYISHFYRASYASAVLGVVILSVRLSHACFVTNPKNRPAIFLYRTKGQSF